METAQQSGRGGERQWRAQAAATRCRGSSTDERRLQTIVSHAIAEYTALLGQNNLSPSKSLFLEKDRALFYKIERGMKSDEGPTVKWVEVSNPNHHPRMNVAKSWMIAEKTVIVDGTSFALLRHGWADASALFDRTPLLGAIYGMLEDDLSLSFGLNRWTQQGFL